MNNTDLPGGTTRCSVRFRSAVTPTATEAYDIVVSNEATTADIDATVAKAKYARALALQVLAEPAEAAT